MSKSKKAHLRASTIGKDVPSVWLPNPGVLYIAGGPSTPSQGTPTPTPTPTPSRKRKRGVNSSPQLPDVEDDKIVQFFTAAFKLLADGVSQLPDSEHKTRLSNILRSFSEVLPDCEAPANRDGDVNAAQ